MSEMKEEQLQQWASEATWHMISEYIVPWTASESRYARELAIEWINSEDIRLQASGWNTYANLMSIQADELLDHKEIKSLLKRVEKEIHQAANRVRYTMNGFVIAVGSYVPALLETAKEVGRRIGEVKVDVGGTACKVPLATAYIEKVEAMGRVGRKKKTAFC